MQVELQLLVEIMIAVIIPIAWALITNHFTVKELKREKLVDKHEIHELKSVIATIKEESHNKYNEISGTLIEIKTMITMLMEERRNKTNR